MRFAFPVEYNNNSLAGQFIMVDLPPQLLRLFQHFSINLLILFSLFFVFFAEVLFLVEFLELFDRFLLLFLKLLHSRTHRQHTNVHYCQPLRKLI